MAQKSNHDEQNEGPLFYPALHLQRYHYAKDLLFKENPPIKRAADFGCAEGGFIKFLKALPFLEELSLIDIEPSALEESRYKATPLAYEFLFGRSVKMNLSIYKGSVSEPDFRMTDLDAITCIELVEHLPSDMLQKFPSNVFGYLRPRIAIITTPNVEYNVLFPQLKAGGFRHYDHKFEWTRAEFKAWCQSIIEKYPDYSFELDGVGEPPEHSKHVGHCTQIAIFRKKPPTKTNNFSSSSCKPITSYTLFDSWTYPKRTIEEKPYEPFDWGNYT